MLEDSNYGVRRAACEALVASGGRYGPATPEHRIHGSSDAPLVGWTGPHGDPFECSTNEYGTSASDGCPERSAPSASMPAGGYCWTFLEGVAMYLSPVELSQLELIREDMNSVEMALHPAAGAVGSGGSREGLS